jgi:hypothetical protein
LSAALHAVVAGHFKCGSGWLLDRDRAVHSCRPYVHIVLRVCSRGRVDHHRRRRRGQLNVAQSIGRDVTCQNSQIVDLRNSAASNAQVLVAQFNIADARSVDATATRVSSDSQSPEIACAQVRVVERRCERQWPQAQQDLHSDSCRCNTAGQAPTVVSNASRSRPTC